MLGLSKKCEDSVTNYLVAVKPHLPKSQMVILTIGTSMIFEIMPKLLILPLTINVSNIEYTKFYVKFAK
jgi:hypothetical protein